MNSENLRLIELPCLRGQDTLDRISAIAAEGDNFTSFLLALSTCQTLSIKGSTLKGKNLLPKFFFF